jgi:hypothetical protein
MGKLFKYGMRLRGFSIGCQPMRGLIEYEPDRTGKYYDILYYGRELTEQELYEYELDKIEE